MEWDLYTHIYGQHLAQDIVSEEVIKFLANQTPARPLVLSLHGGSGTGKTLLSSMLVSNLYNSAMSSRYVHHFIPTFHFPNPERVNEYREDLKAWVTGNLTACARSIFIFDEMERMPAGLLEVLEPFLGPSHVVFGTNYRKAIYMFISTFGGFSGSNIINDGLVTRFVPFLPLCRHHVQRCVRDQLCQQGMCGRTDVVDAVVGDMHYTPAQGQYFSTTGCKSVPAKINFFL
ncbi:hypothetical protein CRUP_018555 [Coryphaenoides rupestris]|nr:hypothetical protein CRUP_018555 [Coryphaenoides rupestris]